MVVLVGNTLAILPPQALLPGLLARMILEVRCPRLPWFLFEVVLVLALLAALLPRATWVALLHGLLARMIPEVRCPREAVLVMALLLSPVLLLAATLQARLESHVFTLDEPTQRMRMQVRSRDPLNCWRYANLIFLRILEPQWRLRLQVVLGQRVMQSLDLLVCLNLSFHR